MAYELEKIGIESQKKIVADMTCDENVKISLEVAMRRGRFPNVWAIDRKHNNYLLKMPVAVRPDSLDVPYLAFINGRCYVFFDEGQNGRWYYFDKNYMPNDSDKSEVEEEIKLGFATYGRWGTGPLNEMGEPKNTVVPLFREEK